jgi:phage terminase large subunit
VGDKEIFYNGEPISDTNQPPPHEENIANGTADLFMWTVYGLGLRGAMQGVIFRNVKYIEKQDVPKIAYIYGMDFGFTSDPTSFHRYWQEGNKVYSELLCYRPIDNPNDIVDMMEQLDIEKTVPIICDSSDRYTSGNNGTVEMVLSLQEAGYEAMKISKTKGVMYWLNLLRQYEINVVVNELTPHVRKEIENYRFKEIQGILINQPVDRWNHWADTLRYTYMAYNDNLEIETEWN